MWKEELKATNDASQSKSAGPNVLVIPVPRVSRNLIVEFADPRNLRFRHSRAVVGDDDVEARVVKCDN